MPFEHLARFSATNRGTDDILNVFNDDSLKGFNTAVTPDYAGPLDELGLPLNYIKGPRFGQAAQLTDHPLGREFRILLGFRF